jgi:hypothetical protein
MCTNTWIPEEEEMIEEQTQEVKISNSIDGLAGLIKKIEDASASINKVTLSLKDIGKEAEIQKEKIYA